MTRRKQYPRPQRQKKGDRLLSVDAKREEVRCDYAIAPFDRLARDMESKWGIDRLPELVSPETAQRYGSAIAHLNESIRAADPAGCLKAAENCMKGLRAMDAEAEAAKARRPNSLFQYDLDGYRFAVIEEGMDWAQLKEDQPDLVVYTMREVAVILKESAGHPLVEKVKDVFPGSEIKAFNRKAGNGKSLEDPIPF